MPDKKEDLKLAKNDKGIEQNIARSKNKMKYVNKTTKSDQMEYGRYRRLPIKFRKKNLKKCAEYHLKTCGDALEMG